VALIPFAKLTTSQRIEAVALRPKWHLSEFKNFAFWVKVDGHIWRRGGHHQLLEGAYQSIMARYGRAPRSKGDLSDWKPGVTFHFSKEC
jgi:hypothetical protein